MMKRIISSDCGFSIVEMMVVLCIGAILMTIAIPNYRSFMASNQASNATFLLNASIQLAKSEAIRRGKNVKVCPINTPNGTNCGGSPSWEHGWLVVDVNTNTTLKVYKPAGMEGVSKSPGGPVTFSASGLLQPITANTFTIKPPGCTQGFQLTVSTGGQTTSSRVSCP